MLYFHLATACTWSCDLYQNIHEKSQLSLFSCQTLQKDSEMIPELLNTTSQSANLITPFWRNKLAQKMGTTLLQQLRNCDGNVA